MNEIATERSQKNMDIRYRSMRTSIAALILTGITTMTNAQTESEELKKVTNDLAIQEAKNKLSAAQKQASLADESRRDAMEEAKASKEFADARKAEYEAEQARLKAKFGTLPSSGIAGNVELADKAGTFEIALLSSQAMNSAALRVAEALEAHNFTKDSTLLIVPFGSVPDFQAMASFVAQRNAVAGALINTTTAANDFLDDRRNAESVAAVGLGIEAISKILSFFNTDYKIGGAELVEDHTLLAEITAAAVKSKVKAQPKIFLKGTYNPGSVDSIATSLQSQLKIVVDKRGDALLSQKRLEGRISDLEKKRDAAIDASAKELLSRKVNESKAVLETVRATIQASDQFTDALQKPDEKIGKFLKDFDFWSASQNEKTYMLIVKVVKSGGSYYTKKNIWTALGKMPFKVMGGVIISYTLFDAKTGEFKGSSIIPIHGGFYSINDVGENIQ